MIGTFFFAESSEAADIQIKAPSADFNLPENRDKAI